MARLAEDDAAALGDTLKARPGTAVSRSGPHAVGARVGASGTRLTAQSVTASELNTQSAMRAAGIGRMRVLAVAMLSLVLVGGLLTVFMDGDIVTKRIAWGSLTVLFGSFAWAFLLLRRKQAADDATVRKVALPLCLAVVAANVAFGLLSAFCAAVSLGLALFSSSVPRRTAAPSYGIIAVGYGLAALATQFGLLTHRPLLAGEFSSPWQWWAAVSAVELLFAAAYVAGVATRRDQARIVREFERAVRKASQREALLAEARDALKQGAGLGGPGRFSDQEIDGFRLGMVIGRGGMGEVYAAERLSDGEPAALKLLRVDLWHEKQALTRFAREAKIVASIDSPHVVRVLEVSGPDAVCPFIAMELLAGVDLGTQLRERGRMSLDDVVDMAEQIAVGLEEAHAANVVHRDLKPQNIFRAGGAHGIVTWKVLDFGVSKLLDAGEASLTAAEIIGTPQYMAPEQARGERDVDGRADVYALAAIAYRALTGEAPFRGDLHSVLRAILEEMPEAPRVRARLPEDVDLVLALGLAKRREDRFQSAREFARAFELAARGELSAELREQARALLERQPYKIAR